MSLGRRGPSASVGAKRTAFVIDAVYPVNKGGRERRLWEIARRLARDGHDVRVFTMKWWSGPRPIELDGVWPRFHPLHRGARRSMTHAPLFGVAASRHLTERRHTIGSDHMPYFPLISARPICCLRSKRLTAAWHEVWGREYWASIAVLLLWLSRSSLPAIGGRSPNYAWTLSP